MGENRLGHQESSTEHDEWVRVLKARQLDVCDAIGDFIEYWGFKRIHGRVWALVALSAKPLPQVEIAQELGVSRSLVSGVVAELVDRGLLRPTEAKRNTPYTAMTDFWPTVAAVLRSREWLLLEKVKIALEGFERRVMVIKDPTSEWGIKAIDVPEEIRRRFF